MISNPENAPSINWTYPMLRRFRVAYAKACIVNNGEMTATFTFDGNEFVIGYAAYLIEFLNGKFGLGEKDKH